MLGLLGALLVSQHLACIASPLAVVSKAAETGIGPCRIGVQNQLTVLAPNCMAVVRPVIRVVSQNQ
jgi:hypothetical protein